MRKYVKKRPWRSRKKQTASKNQREKLLLVKKLYDRYGSLQGVANKLKLTRERIRQLLLKGDYYRLYKYEPTFKKQFKEIKQKVSRDVLKGVLKNETNKFKICEILSIDMRNLYKLIQFYDIDFEDYRQDLRQKKFLMRYSDIVTKLGHHPTTTEMNNRNDWRYTWMAIDRIWGSIENFRKEFGIEKPPHHLHPNTIEGFKRRLVKRMRGKQIKVSKIEEYMREYRKPVKSSDIAYALNLKQQSVYLYLVELRKKGVVAKTGIGMTTKYKLN